MMFSDEYYMELALEEARAAMNEGEVPVGAVVVNNEQVVAKAHNRVEGTKRGMAHAELLALEQASDALGAWRLDNCTLYVTKEPCPMCAGALVNCRVKRVVFGCYDPRTGGAGSALNITGLPNSLHTVEVTSGVLEEQCRGIIQEFFRKRRNEQ